MALLEMITGSWISQAIYVAARLGIADSLHRLLRASTALGLCAERDDRLFELTPLGSHLRVGVTGSVRSFALHWGGSMWPIWGSLFHDVQTGKNPRALVTRKGTSENLAQNSEATRCSTRR